MYQVFYLVNCRHVFMVVQNVGIGYVRFFASVIPLEREMKILMMCILPRL